MSRARKGKTQMQIDLGREIMIDICKDGTFSYRLRGQRPFNNVALPVYSVDTLQDAKDLQRRFCRKMYDRHPNTRLPGNETDGWFKWTDFGGELDELHEVTRKCREWYEGYILANRKEQ